VAPSFLVLAALIHHQLPVGPDKQKSLLATPLIVINMLCD
jgi:hypothetical protein